MSIGRHPSILGLSICYFGHQEAGCLSQALLFPYAKRWKHSRKLGGPLLLVPMFVDLIVSDQFELFVVCLFCPLLRLSRGL